MAFGFAQEVEFCSCRFSQLKDPMFLCPFDSCTTDTAWKHLKKIYFFFFQEYNASCFPEETEKQENESKINTNMR